VEGPRSASSIYEITISRPEDWDEFSKRKLDVVVDPFVFRIGQLFLQGKAVARDRWEAIESDLGALVRFFDLIVLHDQLPAFNYYDTFDFPPDGRDFAEYNDGLREMVNAGGDKTLVHVDVEHTVYLQAKNAALDQLGRRIDEGPLAAPDSAKEILAALDALRYEWKPKLGTLEEKLPEERDQQLARFLLGQLVFTGYAQQIGAPHVLAPRRSAFVASAALRDPLPQERRANAIYDELGRRIRDAGPGWRINEQPWTPSFLPLLLTRLDPYKEGPDVLLRRAKELRESKAVESYRKSRSKLADDALVSEKARTDLTKAADRVARELRADRRDLEVNRSIAVDILPKALGPAVGAATGFVLGGPLGAVAGAAVAPVVQEALTQVNNLVWGWVIDRLPYRSARKLLSRSVWAELELRQKLGPDLSKVWQTGRS
jgi:hypothetical protein